MSELTPAQTWILIIAIYGSVAATYLLVPAVRTAGRYFAVLVDEEFRGSREGLHVRHKYWLTVFGWMLVAMAIHTTSPTTPGVPILALLVQLIGATFAMTEARKAVLPYARTEMQIRTASLAADTGQIPGGLAGIIGPFALLAAAALYLELKWPDLPARFADHYTARSTPNQWVDKSLTSVFGPIATGALILLMTMIGMFAIAHGTPAGTESARRFRYTMLRTQVIGRWILAALVSVLAISRVSEQPLISPGLGVGILLVTLAANAFPMIRLSMQPGSMATPPADRWKLGILYYNPDDPALMVQRRFTVGYTLNFGNRMAWAYIGLVIVLVFATRYFRA